MTDNMACPGGIGMKKVDHRNVLPYQATVSSRKRAAYTTSTAECQRFRPLSTRARDGMLRSSRAVQSMAPAGRERNAPEPAGVSRGAARRKRVLFGAVFLVRPRKWW